MLNVGICIVNAIIFGRISLDKVIAEAFLSDVVLKEVEICLDVFLDIDRGVVEVARSVPWLSGVIGSCGLISVFGTLIIGTDVS